jgi:hypothetical protein
MPVRISKSMGIEMTSDRKRGVRAIRVVLGLCLFVMAGPAAAQLSLEQQGAIRRSCRADFMQNCFGILPGGRKALQCLQRNIANVSPRCQSALNAVTSQAAAVPPPPMAEPQAPMPGEPPAPASVQRPVAAPKVIYVTNFQLDPEAFHPNAGGPLRQSRPGLLGNLVRGVADSKNSAEKIRKLPDLMARDLVRDLERAGFKARRLVPGEDLPAHGWLVRGVFTKIDEGKRFERAVIGFGAGKTALKVVATVDDLEKGKVKPLYTIDEGAHSGDMPGAAVTAAIRFVPYVLAARFLLSGRAIERNVRKIAHKISHDIVERIRK